MAPGLTSWAARRLGRLPIFIGAIQNTPDDVGQALVRQHPPTREIILEVTILTTILEQVLEGPRLCNYQWCGRDHRKLHQSFTAASKIALKVSHLAQKRQNTTVESVIGALSLDGMLLTWIQDHSVQGNDVVRFLKHLLASIPGKILLIWDNLPAHRSRVVKEFLASGATKRLTLKALPGYAPDLNPQEGIWRFLKYVELKNVCCHHLTELRLEVRRAIERLRFKVDVLLGCIRQPGYVVQTSMNA